MPLQQADLATDRLASYSESNLFFQFLVSAYTCSKCLCGMAKTHSVVIKKAGLITEALPNPEAARHAEVMLSFLE